MRREQGEGTRLENKAREKEPISLAADVSIDLLTDDRGNRSDAIEAFEEFWRAYPRKASKGKARSAWTAAVKKTTEERLIAGAAAYAGATARTEPRFIQHPANWLNSEGWLDTPDPRRGFITIDQSGNQLADPSHQVGRRPTAADQVDVVMSALISGRYGRPV